MRVKVRSLPLVAVAALALAACGGDDDSADDAARAIDEALRDNLPGGTLPGGVTIPEITLPDVADATVSLPEALEDLLPGGSLPAALEDLLPGGSLPADLGDLPDIEMAAAGDGSCSVTLTGSVEASWGEQQNTGSGMVSYWFGDMERSLMGDGLKIIANCTGDDGSNFSLLSSNEADETSVPHAPATYELTESGGLLGSSGLWSVLLTVAGSDTVFRIADAGGTLEITEFDDDTLRFVVDATVEDSFAEFTGASTDPAQLHVEFTLTRTA